MRALCLTYSEMCLLKKYVFGNSVDEIKTDLCLESHEEFFLKKEAIKSKLDISNDLNLIEEAFKMGLLVVDDYILKNINHIAFGMAYNIYILKHSKILIDDLHNIYIKVFDRYLSIIKTHEI